MDLDAVVVRAPGVDIFVAGATHVVKSPAGAFLVHGLDDKLLRAVLCEVDGRKTVAEVCASIASRDKRGAIRRMIATLTPAVLWLISPARIVAESADRVPSPPREANVVVVGNGRLGQSLWRFFSVGGYMSVEFICDWPPDALPRRESSQGARQDAGDVSATIQKHDLVICALEDVDYRCVADLWRSLSSSTTCLFIGADPSGVQIGPTTIPGVTACPFCAQLARYELHAAESPIVVSEFVERTRLRSIGEVVPLSALEYICASAYAEAKAFVSGERTPNFLGHYETLSADMQKRTVAVNRSHLCRLCGEERDSNDRLDTALIKLGQAANDNAISLRSHIADSVGPVSGGVGSVAVVGGGTAGYLVALSLRVVRPDLKISILESSRIGTLGVGESTQPEIVPFLHRVLEIDVHDFYEKVRPTWKLGIRFRWGAPAGHTFRFPFDSARPVDSSVYDGNTDHASLLACLMTRDRVPLVQITNGSVYSLLMDYPFAYHIDNGRFVRYLADLARQRDIAIFDVEIERAMRAPNGDRIDRLIDVDGREWEFDFYIDCSGFRSLLLGTALGVEFQDYSSSLFSDSAIAGVAPGEDVIKPYTSADTMIGGWAWNIPQLDEQHVGYVYSSDFISEEGAARELGNKYPGMKVGRTFRYRPGRHARFWVGNVAAFGNAYGFVEPLEASSIQLNMLHALQFAKSLPEVGWERANNDELNRIVAEDWDSYRWFLAAHYKYNHNRRSPFWVHCRENVDVSGIADVLEYYDRGAPGTTGRGGGGSREATPLRSSGYTAILCGQQVPTRVKLEAHQTAQRYRAVRDGYERLSSRALLQREAMAFVRRNPGVLRSHVSDDRSWVTMMANTLFTGGVRGP